MTDSCANVVKAVMLLPGMAEELESVAVEASQVESLSANETDSSADDDNDLTQDGDRRQVWC